MDELKPDAETDALLRDWARATKPSDARLERLAAGILRETRRASLPPRSHARTFSFVAAVAACAALIGLYAGTFFRPQPRAESAVLAEAAAIQWDGLRRLARESDRLFDHRLAWLAETNQQLQLGLDSGAAGDAVASDKPDAPQIAVRVVVFHRDARTDAWRMVFSTNVITRAEEVIQVAESEQGSQLRLWTHVLPDHSVAVDTDLSLRSGTAHWVTSSVSLDANPFALLTDNDHGGQYQVWQSAAVLEDKAL